MQVLLIYYIIANNLGLDNRYVAGVIILSCFSAAYLAEIFRAGILSISISQLESARALGLKEMQVFAYVIFPQALKNILAPLSGQFANLIKDSSLLSVIAVNELTQSAQEINSYTFSLCNFGYYISCFDFTYKYILSLFEEKMPKMI